MGKINVGRVILGGLVAGVVINVSETILNLVAVAQAMEDSFKALGLPALGMGPIMGFVISTFFVGIALVWLYAAIRPRFGPGVGTAVIAGVAFWLAAYAYSSFGMALMGLFPVKLMLITSLWGLAEVVIASIVGASLYKE